MAEQETGIEEYLAVDPIKKMSLKKFDMQYQEREFFFVKLKRNFEAKWFVEKKTSRIIEGFKEFMVGDKAEYIVYVGESPYFIIQAKKDSLMVISVENLSIIIYKPKQVDIPVHFKFNDFNQKKYVEL